MTVKELKEFLENQPDDYQIDLNIGENNSGANHISINTDTGVVEISDFEPNVTTTDNGTKQYVEAVFQPRYFKDADVNGEEEDAMNPKIFGALLITKEIEKQYYFIKADSYSKHYVHWLIDSDSGKIEGWTKGMTAKVHYKICDAGYYRCFIKHKNGETNLSEYVGYVPTMFEIDDDGFGDYMILTILEDGTIKDWNKKGLVIKGS